MRDFTAEFQKYNAIVKHPCNKGCDLPDDYRARAAECKAMLLEPLTELAEKNGYLLLFHGTGIRDLDFVAVPWSSTCSSPICLAEDIRDLAAELCGHAIFNPLEDNWRYHAGSPGGKPHGRLCWTFHLGGGPYIDLSVMPAHIDY